jgi:hypothetical protein
MSQNKLIAAILKYVPNTIVEQYETFIRISTPQCLVGLTINTEDDSIFRYTTTGVGIFHESVDWDDIEEFAKQWADAQIFDHRWIELFCIDRPLPWLGGDILGSLIRIMSEGIDDLPASEIDIKEEYKWISVSYRLNNSKFRFFGERGDMDYTMVHNGLSICMFSPSMLSVKIREAIFPTHFIREAKLNILSFSKE